MRYLTLLLAVCSAHAQTTSGSVAGQVTDPSAAAISGGKVTLTNSQTGIARGAATDTAGNFIFPIVPPGIYSIRVEQSGFKAATVTNLQVQVAQQVTRDIRLEVGDTATSVEVAATATLLDQRSAEVSQVIGQRQMVELPLNGRNFMDLARLAPGVTQLAAGTQSTGLAINGQRANQIGFYFDGIDTRTEERGKPAFSPSIEAIQEFRIQQNSFSAEFGRTPAAINLTLKPGANDLHGTLFEFLRNNALDARSFFSPRVDPLRRNQFGGVVSGPILKNKTFYMANYEGLRTRRAATLFHTVPSQAQRDGDFNEGAPVFDPATYNAAANSRQPFAGNRIPVSRFGQMGTGALKYYPRPNTTGAAFNYLVQTANTDDNDQFHGRLDHQLNERSLIFGRYSWSDGTASTPSGLPFTGTADSTRVHSMTVQESHTFSPTKVNQFRAGWTFYDNTLTFPLTPNNVTFTDFGLLNLNPISIATGVPQLTVVGLSTLGANAFQPQGPRENLYSLADDFSWVAGKHTLKFGYDGRYYRPSGKVQMTPNGILTFQNRYTTQPGLARSGSATADLVLGAAFSGRATAFGDSNGLVSLKHFFHGIYMQDEIRITPKLTVNIGLRYEYQTPYKERYDDLNIFEPSLGRFLEVGKEIETLNRPDRNNWAPRLGVSWTVMPRTVVRAGAGVFYGQPRGSEFTSFQLSPPFVIDTTINSNPNVPDLAGRLFPAPNVRNPDGSIRFTPTTNVFTLDRNFRSNYTYQWNLGVQRELVNNLLLEVGYVGNGAHKLTGRDLVNQAFPDADPTRATPVQGRRPNPNIGDVSVVKSLDNSNYHALNVRLDKRFSNGFSLLGAYTWSKVMGIGGSLSGDQSNQQDARNRRAEYGVLEFNQDQRITLAWIYELPVFQKRALLGGWSFQGSFTAHTGFPLTPRSSVNGNVGRQDQQRPNRVCDGNLETGSRNIDRWFDTACFPLQPFGRFGNSGAGVIEGPGLQTFNLTGMKNTRIPIGRAEPATLQFRAEFFNAFNHPVFGDPNMNIGTAQVGIIRSTRVGGRQIQMALKLIF